MSKWKCEICRSEFENFHAQGFDNKIYCPLCYLKKENEVLKKQLEVGEQQYNDLVEEKEKLEVENQELKKQLEDKEDFINKLQATKDKLNKWNYESTMKQKEFIKYLEDNWEKTQDIWYIKILQKYKEIIGE